MGGQLDLPMGRRSRWATVTRVEGAAYLLRRARLGLRVCGGGEPFQDCFLDQGACGGERIDDGVAEGFA